MKKDTHSNKQGLRARKLYHRHNSNNNSITKNFGYGSIENITINDSTIQSTPGGDILIDEDKRRVLSSSCLADGLSLQAGETCEISYEVDVIKESTTSISVNVTYNNPDDQKEYATRIFYRGTPPPVVVREFIGPESPSAYDFSKVPIKISKEKSFFFRNTGKTDAKSFTVGLINTSSTNFSIFYNTCDFEDSILSYGETCEIK